MTPADYMNEIAIPTAIELGNNRTSRRLAYLSAISTYHLCDHLKASGVADAFSRMSQKCQYFGAVQSICNGAKHMLRDQNRMQKREFSFRPGTELRLRSRLVLGRSPIGKMEAATLMIEWRANSYISIYSCVFSALTGFKAEFPDALSSCDLSALPPMRKLVG